MIAQINGKEVKRSYTPVSCDEDKGYVDLVIKVTLEHFIRFDMKVNVYVVPVGSTDYTLELTPSVSSPWGECSLFSTATSLLNLSIYLSVSVCLFVPRYQNIGYIMFLHIIYSGV